MSYQSRSFMKRLLSIGLGVSVVATSAMFSPAFAQAQPQEFPDVPEDYWARPFIQRLVEQGVIAGYPDGTFKPERNVQRDEFSALIRRAFDRPAQRQLNGASNFEDVPNNYWATTPIEQSYQQGFLNPTGENEFSPRQEISRADALVAITDGLNLTYTPTDATQAQAPATSQAEAPGTSQATTAPQAQTPVARNGNRRQRTQARRNLLFPLASTALMQSFIAPAVAATQRQAQTTQPEATQPTRTTTQTQAQPADPSAPAFLSNYYQDTDRIPEYAVNDVAAATRENVVVNHPQVRILRPTEPLNRGTAAAWIHQAMVRQGRIEPLPREVEASRYIVSPQQNQTVQPGQ